MSYHSDVSPGEVSKLELDGLTMWKLCVSSMHNNVYVLRDEATGKRFLIDAADDAPAIRKVLDEAGDGALVGLLTTHKHWDHVRALAEIAPLATTTFAGEKDAGELPVPPSETLSDGDVIHVGETMLTAHHVPGHTPGSVVLSWDGGSGIPHLWTGDTLFPGGVGATRNNDEQSFPELFGAVKERIFERFDDSVIHPGHGDDTTLATERPHLAEWKKRGW